MFSRTIIIIKIGIWFRQKRNVRQNLWNTKSNDANTSSPQSDSKLGLYLPVDLKPEYFENQTSKISVLFKRCLLCAGLCPTA